MSESLMAPPEWCQAPAEYNDSYANSGNEVPIPVNGTYGDQVSYNLDGAPHRGPYLEFECNISQPRAL